MMKRALIATVIVFGLVICVGGVMVYRSVRRFLSDIPPMQQVPPRLKTAAVLYGGAELLKTSYLKTNWPGTITDIDEHTDGTLTLIGKEGAADFGADLSPKRTISFDSCSNEVVSAPIGKGMYLCRSPSPMGGPSLIDTTGVNLWTYSDHRDRFGISADDAAAGELGPAHTMGIAVGMNGDGGVRLLTPDGKEVWRKPDGNVWHIEIMPRGDASRNVIVHSNAPGKLTVRDENGDVLGLYDAEIYMDEFSPTAWGSKFVTRQDSGSDQSIPLCAFDGRKNGSQASRTGSRGQRRTKG